MDERRLTVGVDYLFTQIRIGIGIRGSVMSERASGRRRGRESKEPVMRWSPNMHIFPHKSRFAGSFSSYGGDIGVLSFSFDPFSRRENGRQRCYVMHARCLARSLLLFCEGLVGCKTITLVSIPWLFALLHYLLD